jgi:hypothetical protein
VTTPLVLVNPRPSWPLSFFGEHECSGLTSPKEFVAGLEFEAIELTGPEFGGARSTLSNSAGANHERRQRPHAIAGELGAVVAVT